MSSRKMWESWEDDLIRQLYPIEGYKSLTVKLVRSSGSICGRASALGVKAECGSFNKASARNSVNLHYFEEWGPRMVYWSGYTWADGTIGFNSKSGTPNVVRYDCKSADEELVLEVRKELNSKHKIQHRPEGFDSKGRWRGPQTICCICGSLLVKPLIEMQGMLPAKSFLDLPLPAIPPEWFYLFVRGVF